MNLPRLSVKRPVTTVMAVFVVLLLGFVSLTRLPMDLFPEIDVPVAIVNTSYSGVGPQEVEKLVTSPVEEALATVSNVNEISSVSYEGRSIVIVEFNYGTDMDFASLEMREKIDMIKSFLPDGIEDPIVMKIDPNAFPIIQMSLTGENDLAGLRNFAEDVIKSRLERLEGVASVDISGGSENRIKISIHEHSLRGYGLSIDYIAQVIGTENLNLPGGSVKKGKNELSVKTVGEFTSLKDISNLSIPIPTGGNIILSDIADISIDSKDTTSITMLNGKKSINISIYKSSGTNTVDVSRKVRTEIDNIKSLFPGRDMEMIMDQAVYIERSINNVMNNALIGGLLAILILYLFFRNIRTTLIIGTAIPISFIATFSLIYFNGITLNMMTLGGLALGVGMLVDNSIVVLENIYRFRENGLSRRDAAVRGASEVGMAVTASTFTTIAVFLPIVFVEGITSTLFKELALTVTFSLLASLVVSLTLIPMLSSKLLRIVSREERKKKDKKRLFAVIYAKFDKAFLHINSGYKKLLSWSLYHRKTTIITGILIFAVSMAGIINTGAEFFPQTDEGQFTISIKLPEGADLERTKDVTGIIEEILKEIDEVNTVYTNVGNAGNRFITAGTTNMASVNVLLKDIKIRKRSTAEVADNVRSMVMDIPDADIDIDVSSMMMTGFGGDSISISIKGDDTEILRKTGNDFVDIVEKIEGTREVKSDFGEGIPEITIRINRSKSSYYGLTSAHIANSVKNILSGMVATRYKQDGSEMDVLVCGDEIFGRNIQNLGQILIKTPQGLFVQLSQVADIIVKRGPSIIKRESQSRVVTVSGQIFGRDLSSVSSDIKKKLQAYNMPPGYSYELRGQYEELNNAFNDLYLALILAVILVYMVLASQFESLLHPFTIMLSAPIGFSGGAIALFLTGKTLSVSSIIGAIILAGIVVNDAIVLIDYINTRRKNGEERTVAILNAGPIRLRPIIITTATTVLALLPMAIGIGEGSEILSPMATVVIGGLTLATILTLVFIPVVYTLFDDISVNVKQKHSKNRQDNEINER
jgi:hydrophobic/amphiphilic exporter-1 (mainly G- bacteria), HAE1 family